jgi:formate dehydrogenase subunit beta
MEKITEKMRATAKLALENGEVEKIIGWKKGDTFDDSYPVFITEVDKAESLIWDCFCVNNLSKYLIQQLKDNEKVGVFLKGCDSRAFNQIVKDNRIDRDKVVVYGVSCPGMIDPEKVKKEGLHKGLLSVKRSGNEIIFVKTDGEKKVSAQEFEYDKCIKCRYPNPVVYDQLMSESIEKEVDSTDRFKDVEDLEALSVHERSDYWDDQFSKCIRCNACRNICPACSCVKCIFDNDKAEVSGKANVASEEQFFHIIRAYHVAGRCVECGECSRVCPAGIPLHKLNSKIIKDINELYGEYDAGVDISKEAPIGTYKLDDRDSFTERGGEKK